FTKETAYYYPADDTDVDKIVETVKFTETLVLKELLGLNESKSPSPEELPAKILKELTIMEKIIKQQLMQFLEQNHLLLDVLHGFRRERWTEAVDRRNSLHAVYMDFKKTLDSMPHHCLISKLSGIGVRVRFLAWIEIFILGRSQTVHISNKKSAKAAVESSVPQGSVLGPVLFIIHINDCVSELDCGIAMFADGIKPWRVIRTAADEENLQTNLNRLQKWSKDWLFPFNESKCNIIRVGKINSSKGTVYRLDGIPLEEVNVQEDLGVWIKPSLHCAKVAKSVIFVLYLVKVALSASNSDCFTKVFGTFVRPQLGSAIQAWRPWAAKDINTHENVQRRATKLFIGQDSRKGVLWEND
ncbi:unnamed protein product, partial [Dibothriocephalus latus]